MVKKSDAKKRQANNGNTMYAPKLYISQYDSHFHSLTLPNGIAKLPEENAPEAISNNPINIL